MKRKVIYPSVERGFFLQSKGSRNIQYTVLKVSGFTYTRMAWWLSWLERRPVTAEVESSSLFRVAVDENQQQLNIVGS